MTPLNANIGQENTNMPKQEVSIGEMTSCQKVAALLILLGPTTASEVLKNISEE